MLSYRMLNDEVLEVMETKFEMYSSYLTSERTFWYYNIKTWLKSSHGKENDIPDRKMTDSDIEWVKKYYIPKTILLDTF